MPIRTIFAFDNEALLVESSTAQNPGDTVINNSNSPDGTIYRFQPGFQRVEVNIDDTGGSADLLEDDQAANHIVTNGNGIIANGQSVEGESTIDLQQIDDAGNPIGQVITITVLSQGGVTQDVWAFATMSEMVPGARYQKVSGTNIGTTPYSELVCFVAGTHIATEHGPRPVETLSAGTLVETRDQGLQPLKAVLTTTVAKDCLSDTRLWPIRIEAGALGDDLPRRPLQVSRQHRMLSVSKVAARMFGASEVLIAAHKLCDLPGVAPTRPDGSVTYVHLVLDHHAILFAEGAPSESLLAAPGALQAMSPGARNEILRLFPELDDNEHVADPARVIPKGARQSAMIRRHVANSQPLLASA